VVFISRKGLIFSLCLIALLFTVMPMNVYAIEANRPNIEHPALRWTNVASIGVILRIDNNGRAVMAGDVVANIGTESITVDVLLERVNPNGTTTHIWSQNGLRTNGNTWVWERPHMVARGHDYRLKLTATAVRNGVSEIVTISRTTWAA
jgi:hypothetical protein